MPTEEKKNQKDRLGKTAAALAVAGILWLGLISVLLAWVYEPVGVSPRDLGLASSAQLGQAASGLAASLFILMALALAISALITLAQFLRDPDTKQEREKLTPEEKLVHSWTSVVLTLGVSVVPALVVGAIVLVISAGNGRSAIKEGEQPGFILGLPPPWTASSANVHPLEPAGSKGYPALPPCALFLGEADGTVVLRTSEMTIRVPASSVKLDLLDRHECPAGQS